MNKRYKRQTVTFTDRGERVAVELGINQYEAYARQAAHVGVPVEAVIRKDLKPMIGYLRRVRRDAARRAP